MQVTYSIPENQDADVVDAFEERPEKTIRIRFQPDVFRANRGERGRYDAWKGVHWMVECQTPGEAVALREALRLFFSRCSEVGPDGVRALLMQAVG